MYATTLEDYGMYVSVTWWHRLEMQPLMLYAVCVRRPIDHCHSVIKSKVSWKKHHIKYIAIMDLGSTKVRFKSSLPVAGLLHSLIVEMNGPIRFEI